MGSDINTQKSKIIDLMIEDERIFTIDGHNLERVDRFVFLGITICEDGDVRSEVNTIIGKASSALNSLKNVWNFSGFTQKTKA